MGLGSSKAAVDEQQVAEDQARQEREAAERQQQEAAERQQQIERQRMNRLLRGEDEAKKEAIKRAQKARSEQLKALQDQSSKNHGGYAAQHKHNIQQPGNRGSNHR